MFEFDHDFSTANGAPVIHNGIEIIRIDRIPVEKKFSGTVKLISTNSEWKQAVRLMVEKGKLKIEPDDSKGYFLWEDYLRNSDVYFEGTTTKKELIVHNAWRNYIFAGKRFTNYWQRGAAMIREINGNTRRYRCNDGHPDDNFDDIIFEVIINE